MQLFAKLYSRVATQKSEESLQAASSATNEKMEVMKDSVISAISLLSSVQGDHTESLSNQLKSSYEALKETIEKPSQSSTAQSRALEDAIQKAQEAVELSSNQIQTVVENEG